MTRREIADKTRLVLQATGYYPDDDRETGLSDTLANLKHLAHQDGLNWSRIEERSEGYLSAEIGFDLDEEII